MAQNEFGKDRLIKYWIDSSDDDYDTMVAMYKSQKYTWTLFIGHLMIEKLLKALHVKANNDYPPFIHNLVRLAEKCGLDLTEEQKLFLVTITAFNINARYDDYQLSFKQKCTPDLQRYG